LHKNAFGGRALPEAAGGSYSSPADLLAIARRRGDEEGEGKN